MKSRHSTLAPALEEAAEESPALTPPRGSRFKPKRDALTRVRHDLRSMVHAMLGYSDLLTEPHYGTLSAEQARFVDHVRAAAENLQELVDTCIELSRAPSDALAVKPPVVRLMDALKRALAALHAVGVVCKLTRAPDPELHIPLDCPAFSRALAGLALVAARDGEVACTLQTYELQGRTYLRLRADDAAASEVPFALLDTLEDEIGNRDFVRLKLSEVLLSRQGIALRLTPALDTFDLELT